MKNLLKDVPPNSNKKIGGWVRVLLLLVPPTFDGVSSYELHMLFFIFCWHFKNVDKDVIFKLTSSSIRIWKLKIGIDYGWFKRFDNGRLGIVKSVYKVVPDKTVSISLSLNNLEAYVYPIEGILLFIVFFTIIFILNALF